MTTSAWPVSFLLSRVWFDLQRDTCAKFPVLYLNVSLSSWTFKFTDAAGYNEKQCCAAVPDGVACNSANMPVECGPIPCVYSNQCEATAAGWSQSDCCPQANGACTADNDPVACGDNKCMYSSTSCAELAGFSSDQCCKQPKELGACTREFAPIACSTANCIYDNPCIASK